MVNLQATTTTGTYPAIQETAIAEFRSSLGGDLILPGDADYDQARQVWNSMINKQPGLIVRCAGVADVINCVNFARNNNLLVSVRGGAHSAAGNATCDGGIVIDLSRMKGIRVDPVKQTAHAQGGALWKDLDRETQAFGLATPGGTVNDTGIAGLTLGGGLGWLTGKYGLSCDNLLSADVVTADGKFLTASATQNPDLFWGLRGGSGNFGVVTSFEYQLHSVSQVLGGMLIYPRDQAREVLRFYRDFSSQSPDELTSAAALLTSPEGQPITLIALCYSGPIEEGERELALLRQFGPPVADLIGPKTYLEVQSMLDPAAFPHGIERYWKSGFLKQVDDQLIDLVVDQSANLNPLSVVLLFHFRGAAGRVDPGETAFNLRADQWDFDIISQWTDPAEREQWVHWTRDFWAAAEPFTTGQVYVNHLNADDAEQRVRSAFSNNYERLVEIKNKYDPKNLFRVNHNIKPTV